MKDIHNDVKGQSEDALQQKCVFWFNGKYPHLRGLFFSVPNGGFRNKIEAKKLVSTGTVKGVSDTIFLYGGRCFLIEMKNDTGRQSEAQIKWQRKVEEQGFIYFLVNTLIDFKHIINTIV